MNAGNEGMVDGGAGAGGGRVASLDAFRGMDILLMFFVNLSADRNAFPDWFGHAGWNGGRHGQWLADFVFPWFLFIVGAAIPYSMNSGRGRGLSAGQRILGALRRGVVIYLLGIVIWCAKSCMDSVVWKDGQFAAVPGTPITWGTFLHWDILPLIAFGYVLGVVVYHLPRAIQIGLVVAVLVGKWMIMPDLSVTVGLERAAWVSTRTDWDAAVRGIGWAGTMITQGLPAACTVVLGMWSGGVLRTGGWFASKRAWALMGAGAATALLALLWSLRFPVSKDFFTSTYVLLSAGTGAMVLGACYGVLDAWKWERWKACLALAAVVALTVFGAKFGGGFTPGQSAATATMAGVLVATLLLVAMADVVRGCRHHAQATMLAIYGSNAILLYFASEVLWTMVWMRWRVMCPGDFGGQVAFAALQTHLRFLVEPAVGASLAKGLGPWLATSVYALVYWSACAALHRRKIFLKI